MERQRLACQDRRGCGASTGRRVGALPGVCRCLLAVLATVVAEAGAPRRPVPDEPLQERARQQVRTVFADDLARAKGSTERQATLATTLLEQVAQTREPALQFVLLQMGVEAAVQAADVATAWKAIEKLESQFLIDAPKLKLETLETLSRTARTPSSSAAVVEQLMALVEERVAADDYPAALQAAQVAVEEVRRHPDLALRKRVVGQLHRAEQIAAAYETVKPALDTLGRSPADPAASAAVGKFLCLVKGEWKRGLPLLARSDDPAFRAAAQAELQLTDERQANALRVADAWWELTERAEEAAREPLRAHALENYRLALPKLAGLDRVRVDRRLAETSRTAVSAAAPAKSVRRPTVRPKILQAVYGKSKRVVDVTAAIQAAVAKDPYLPIRVDMYLNGGIDPAPYQHKTLLLRYQIGRTVTERLLHEREVETIPPLPKEGLALAEAADQFTVLAARYGAGVTWYDATSHVAATVSDPTAAFNFTPAKVVDDQTRKSCHALVVWFDYQGRRYVRVFDHVRQCLLLPP